MELELKDWEESFYSCQEQDESNNLDFEDMYRLPNNIQNEVALEVINRLPIEIQDEVMNVYGENEGNPVEILRKARKSNKAYLVEAISETLQFVGGERVMLETARAIEKATEHIKAAENAVNDLEELFEENARLQNSNMADLDSMLEMLKQQKEKTSQDPNKGVSR